VLEPHTVLWLVAAAPLLGCLLITCFAFAGGEGLRRQSHWPCIVGLAVSACCSAAVLLAGPPAIGSPQALGLVAYQWLAVGGLDVAVSLQADRLTAVMLVVVTSVSLLVAVYSVGYMHGDPGYARFFAAISLFVFSMTMLVMASNFLLLFVFWEAVGLCSYLLIGFWYQKPTASAAARKAFLVNRIGDLGFMLGVFLVWTTFGTVGFAGAFEQAQQRARLHETQVRAAEAVAGAEWSELMRPGPAAAEAQREHDRYNATVLAICLLLFVGAVGKSAQFPLHVWLPDAMEGPSPVSALIHAATMVTAGVYMVARCLPLFELAPAAQLVVAGVGTGTALLAALIALTQTDLKRVLAYSTVSQLGLMFLALGCAARMPQLAAFAAAAALFHLFTHAYFKALLFLGAGSVMHAMGDVIDMRRFGGLRRLLPWTHAVFLIGALALAAIVPLAGFWSKDEILLAVYAASGGPYAGFFLACLIVFLAVAFLTAFYTFRTYFITFWGEERVPPEAGAHPHEAPWSMRGPLLLLAGAAALVGLVFGPTHWFSGYLAPTLGEPTAGDHAGGLLLLLTGGICALAGLGLAWLFYVQAPTLPDQIRAAAGRLFEFSRNRFYLDEIYQLLIVGPATAVAYLCKGVEAAVDGLVDLIGWLPGALGRLFRPVQNGLVQFYALAMLLGLAVLVAALVARLGG